MDIESNEPESPSRLLAIPGAARDDAFTGEEMARFCEVLARTGVVTRACRAIGRHKDTAYDHRSRNPLFAQAWAAAVRHARTPLADTLLERSIDGSVDYLYRDGELVGERRYTDNRLAYAMLRRLDKQAEAEAQPVPAREPARPASKTARLDWDLALRALRTGSEDDVCAAMAMLAGRRAGESDDSDDSDDSDHSDDSDDPLDRDFADGFESDSPLGNERVWEEEPGEWRTNYPPPAGFDGDEVGRWDEESYDRACTADESRLLNAAREASLASYRAEEEAARDAYFADVKAVVAQPRAGRPRTDAIGPP